MLLQMVHDAGGTAAVKSLFESGRTTEELRAALMRQVGTDWTDVAARWRTRILGYEGPAS
jgi:hypothetical protein